MTNHPRPDEPLTCSEVVERLQLLAYIKTYDDGSMEGMIDSVEAEKVLHSWRERRVQELEERLGRAEALLASVRWAVTRAQDEEIGSFLGEQVK